MNKEREPASGATEGARRATGEAPEERRDGRGRTQEPSFSQNLLRGLWFCGTFSPSRRQILCTRSLPTHQPASRNLMVIRR